MSQSDSDSTAELYDAMRAYTATAFRLLSERCAPAPPKTRPFSDEWRRDSDGLFRLYDESEPYWRDCITTNWDALHSLQEYRHLFELFARIPYITQQVDQLVGTSMTAFGLDAERVADALMWRLLKRHGVFQLDDEMFRREFAGLDLLPENCSTRGESLVG